MRVLAIETSCDETAVCLIEAEGAFGNDFSYKILGNELISQAALHAEFGGVFPNLAKREHGRNLVPLTSKVLKDAGAIEPSGHNSVISQEKFDEIDKLLVREQELSAYLSLFLAQHKPATIDAIAVTAGPGLEPALWVGINFAKALSIAWELPIVAVNHMEGHVIASMVNQESSSLQSFEFPVLSLLISGGHTELVLSQSFMSYEVIGKTRDDAAGEAFDKVARLMDLPYPGGPEISRLAAEARSKEMKPEFKLPRPMMHEDTYDFSFSGLKTAVRRIVEANTPLSEKMKLMIAMEFEDTVSEVLLAKTLRAADEKGVQTIVMGGGVSANTRIKDQMMLRLEDHAGNISLLTPSLELATDNAIMIALAGYFHAHNEEFIEPEMLRAVGQLKLGAKLQ